MNANINNLASDATVNSFSAGYRAVDKTLNAVSAVTSATGNTARTAGHSVTGFFSGVKYAVAQRRGKTLAAKLSRDEQRIVDEIKREEAMRSKREFYSRATGNAVPSTASHAIILVGSK